MNWFNMHDFQSFHKDSLMHFEAASVFCIHQIGKGPNRKNLGKVLVVSGGNLGGTGGGRTPTFVENDEFSEILTYKRAKNSLFE
jgi:hypothetical protein